MTRCAIIGGGISGLVAAYKLSNAAPSVRVTVFEASARLGGVIRSDQLDGCVIEGGPDSFLTQKRAGAQLCRELGIQDSLVGSRDEIRKTFILHEGQLKTLPEGFFLMVPTSPVPFMKTNLVSWPGKFAALSDLFSLPETADTTVAEFIERRFGTEILQQIAEPLLSGIYGAGVSRLSMKNALPQLWEMQKNGSLLLQLLRKRNHSSGESLFTTIQGGMETLVKALVQNCKDVKWEMSSPVDLVEKSGKQWSVRGELFDAVIVASPVAPAIESSGGSRISEILSSIRRNSALVALFGFEKITREGFGWLVPAAERRSVLACTYLSNKFPGRGPENIFLVRVFIGGANADTWMERSDDEVLLEARSELSRIGGISETPRFQTLFRWKCAMPEYAVDHDVRMSEVEKLARAESNLYFTGSLWAGVGIPDCIRHAEKTVEELCRTLEARHVV